jgi:hypothetical protein
VLGKHLDRLLLQDAGQQLGHDPVHRNRVKPEGVTAVYNQQVRLDPRRNRGLGAGGRAASATVPQRSDACRAAASYPEKAQPGLPGEPAAKDMALAITGLLDLREQFAIASAAPPTTGLVVRTSALRNVVTTTSSLIRSG